MLALGSAVAKEMTIKHDEGQATIKSEPKRVLVMDEEALGWLAALGVSDRVVGIASTYFTPTDLQGSKIKPEVLKKGFYGRVKLNNPAYIGSWTTPNLETMTALKPDFIVRLTWDGNKNYDKFSKIAPIVGYKEGGEGFWQKGFRDLGKIFGKEKKAEEMIQKVVDTNKSNAKKLTEAGVFKKYSKVVVLAPFASGSNWVYTDVRLIPDLRALGFKDGYKPVKAKMGIGEEISTEALLGFSKDTLVVLFPPGGKYNGAPTFLKTPVGKKIKDQSILYVPEDFSPYTGPLISIRNSNELTKLILDKVK